MTGEITALVVQLCELLISWVWSSAAYLLMCQGNLQAATALLKILCYIYCSGAGALVAELLHPCSDGWVDSWGHGFISYFMQSCPSSLMGLLSVSSTVQAYDICPSWPKLHTAFFTAAGCHPLSCTWVVEARPKGIIAKRVKRREQTAGHSCRQNLSTQGQLGKFIQIS